MRPLILTRASRHGAVVVDRVLDQWLDGDSDQLGGLVSLILCPIHGALSSSNIQRFCF
jgi:hypothetical protein